MSTMRHQLRAQFQERHQDYVIGPPPAGQNPTVNQDSRLASVAAGQLVSGIELQMDPDAPFLHLAAAEGENGVGPADSPEHPGLFEAHTDYGFAASLYHAGPDKQVLVAELGVAHTFGVLVEILGLGEDLLGQIRIGDLDGVERADQFLNLARVEVFPLGCDPALPLRLCPGGTACGPDPTSVGERERDRQSESRRGSVAGRCSRYIRLRRRSPLSFPPGSSRDSRLPDRAAFRTLQPFRWRRNRWSSPGRGWGNLPRPIWSGETRIPAWLRAWGPALPLFCPFVPRSLFWLVSRKCN